MDRYLRFLLATSSITLGALALVVIGCKDDDGITDPPKPYVLDTTLAIMPLFDGYSYSLMLTRRSIDGVVEQATNYPGPYTIDLVDTVGGVQRFYDGWSAYMWNGPRGLWMKNLYGDTSGNLLLKWPCALADTYSTRLYGLPVLVRVARLDAVVTVDSRRDTCVVYSYYYRGAGADTLMSVWYVAPGVGVMMEDQYVTQSSIVVNANTPKDMFPLLNYARWRLEYTINLP
jgi:hypothetical protein